MAGVGAARRLQRGTPKFLPPPRRSGPVRPGIEHHQKTIQRNRGRAAGHLKFLMGEGGGGADQNGPPHGGRGLLLSSHVPNDNWSMDYGTFSGRKNQPRKATDPATKTRGPFNSLPRAHWRAYKGVGRGVKVGPKSKDQERPMTVGEGGLHWQLRDGPEGKGAAGYGPRPVRRSVSKQRGPRIIQTKLFVYEDDLGPPRVRRRGHERAGEAGGAGLSFNFPRRAALRPLIKAGHEGFLQGKRGSGQDPTIEIFWPQPGGTAGRRHHEVPHGLCCFWNLWPNGVTLRGGTVSWASGNDQCAWHGLQENNKTLRRESDCFCGRSIARGRWIAANVLPMPPFNHDDSRDKASDFGFRGPPGALRFKN